MDKERHIKHNKDKMRRVFVKILFSHNDANNYIFNFFNRIKGSKYFTINDEIFNGVNQLIYTSDFGGEWIRYMNKVFNSYNVRKGFIKFLSENDACDSFFKNAHACKEDFLTASNWKHVCSCDFVSCCNFTWSTTKEGYTYWRDLSEKWSKHEIFAYVNP